MKDDSIYVAHVLECIRRVEENTAAGKDRFMATHSLQDAVLRNLQTMAESAQRLSEATKAMAPDVEWRRIVAFRNILAHDYLGIDLDRIWRVVKDDLPMLKGVMRDLEQRIPSKD